MKFDYFYFLFLIGVCIFRFLRNRGTQNRKGGEVFAKPIFTIQFLGYILLVILTILEFFFMKRSIILGISLFGLLLYILGIIIREWAIKALGRHWSADIRIQENHCLIKDGPYKYLRHPNLLCLLLEAQGLCLIPNAYYSLIFVWFIYFPLILLRIHLEEKVLIENFGEEYLDYKREVFALLPIVRRK